MFIFNMLDQSKIKQIFKSRFRCREIWLRILIVANVDFFLSVNLLSSNSGGRSMKISDFVGPTTWLAIGRCFSIRK